MPRGHCCLLMFFVVYSYAVKIVRGVVLGRSVPHLVQEGGCLNEPLQLAERRRCKQYDVEAPRLTRQFQILALLHAALDFCPWLSPDSSPPFDSGCR